METVPLEYLCLVITCVLASLCECCDRTAFLACVAPVQSYASRIQVGFTDEKEFLEVCRAMDEVNACVNPVVSECPSSVTMIWKGLEDSFNYMCGEQGVDGVRVAAPVKIRMLETTGLLNGPHNQKEMIYTRYKLLNTEQQKGNTYKELDQLASYGVMDGRFILFWLVENTDGRRNNKERIPKAYVSLRDVNAVRSLVQIVLVSEAVSEIPSRCTALSVQIADISTLAFRS
ncbi:hypothetical protein CAPTEDRAFT_212981 [Capitella teleta]|uniref:Ubiquitin-like domain-containing protein n=1 Tax=Capitella teleta TaxID=283909 RepID=R7UGA4_CAPTE|nr:hypothetical protein CAPTEDRAFT_212981 [Capitella teleta]|eukprot:ELU02833.1 hypothetical protein CAPTEDRAFT_212981 [Capitella teleta]